METKTINAHHCYKCGKEMEVGQRWYHADQDDLICLECARETKHTETAYAGQYVKDMPIEKLRISKFFKVVVCQCGRLQEHEETSDYRECTYESTRKLTDQELKGAYDEGHLTWETQKGCEDCAYEEAMANEQEYANGLEEMMDKINN